MALTDTGIKKARTGERPIKLFDGDGLFLHLMPTGSKIWRLAYRVDGKQKMITFGKYPEVSLAQAREKGLEARKKLAAQVDPVEDRRAVKKARAAAAENSFETVARQWYAHWKTTKNERHAGYVLARLEADVFPAIGARPIVDIQAPELVQMVKAIEARGAKDIAKRCLQMSGQVFRYAIAHGVGGATRNPATDIKPTDVLTPRKKENYARIDARELPDLMRKIEGYQGTPTTRLAIKLMALTFVRTGELIGARWEEFDLKAKRWDIPASRMKMKTPHIVPLSTQAVEVLQVLHGVTGGRELLFPGERDHAKPMSNNTILGALDRMGYAGKMTGHGFRGLASTILHEQGFDHQHIELQLAHMERNEVSAAYNHALFLQQRVSMMQWYADYLEGVTRGNVLPLRKLVA
jgi:integrase